MFNYILIAFDGSKVARKALEIAIDMAEVTKARLALVSVEANLPQFPADIGEIKEEKQVQNGYFKTAQREARELAKMHGIDLHRVDVLAGHVSKTIIDHARNIKCDLIIMGHSGQSGAWADFLGSTVDKVSRHAHCTVMIVR